ncbi:MAG TPA: methionyl-tRNA formyltransferase [Candidatus Paceibacterota bacterium]|jgi:methionyl-tRNA formyltransferase
MFLNQQEKKKGPRDVRYAFFGTPHFAVGVLDQLEAEGFIPARIITAPDKARGRGMEIAPPPAKVWGTMHSIPVSQPEHIDDDFIDMLGETRWDLFVVAAYRFILPQELLKIPLHGALNVHPSLLPRWRGPSPIQTAILNDDGTGVSIMLIDDEIDHGPLLASEVASLSVWPPKANELERILASQGGKLLASVIIPWVTKELEAIPQDHSSATFSKKTKTEDGLIDVSGDPHETFRKIQAYSDSPGAYFFVEKQRRQIRVKVTDATLTENTLTILRVIPEGKREMSYPDFMRENA